MNIEVTKEKVSILNNDFPHENEYKIRKCHFTFDEFTEQFPVKMAIFTSMSTGEKYETNIVNGECDIPVEVLKIEYDTVKLGVYSFEVETIEEDGKEKEVLKQRTSPSYDTFTVPTGSYEEGATSPEMITPSQYDIYSQALEEGLEQVANVNIDAEKVEDKTTITITNRYGVTKSVEVVDGKDAKINGYNTITLQEGTNISIEQEEGILTINNTYDDSEILQDISDLQENKANINDLSTVAFSGEYNDLNNKPDLSVYATNQSLNTEIQTRQNSDIDLQRQIDAITVSSDVVDIVGTYQELLAYDTSKLTNNDIIKVLDDSTHNNALSYYKWHVVSNVGSWVYVGSEGPFYTKGETDTLLNAKQNTIDSSHKLNSDLVDDTSSANKFVTSSDKENWNNKYTKASTGIPKSDLSSSVQASLDKADTSIQDVSDKEDKLNKVTSIDENSTDIQYPSAKCVYDSQEEQNEKIDTNSMIYNLLPTTSGSGESVTLNNTGYAPIKSINLKGNTSQETITGEAGTEVEDTSIYVSDVDNTKEDYITLQGNTYQYTTTGKNLFDKNGTQLLMNAASLTILDTGVRAIVTSSGSYRYKGIKIPNINNLLGESLILSATIQVSASNNGRICFVYFDSNNVMVGNPFSNLRETGTVAVNIPSTLPTNAVGVAILFYANENGTANANDYVDYTNLQLELGSTPTDYEPFTGNSPSPNPNYPQNIEVVTGENVVSIVGKNILNNSTMIASSNCTIENGIITSSSLDSYKVFDVNIDNIKLEKNVDYYATFQMKLNSGSGSLVFGGALRDETLESTTDKTAITTPTISSSYQTYCWKINTNLDNFNATILRFQTTSNASNVVLSIKDIIISKNANDTYEAYSGQNYEINLGKNLFDKNGVFTDGYLYQTGNTETSNNFKITDYISIKPNTYYTTSGMNNGTGNAPSRCYYDKNKNFISGLAHDSQNPITDISPVNAYYMRESVRIIDFDTIQIEEGVQATQYASYFTPIELCKIGTDQDYLYKSNGKWYLHKEIGDAVLYGTENWDVLESTFGYRFRTPLANSIESVVGNVNSYCSHFSLGATFYNKNVYAIGATGNINIALDETYTTLKQFKEWVSTQNIKVYYVLATPTSTEITNETLISQLDALYTAQLNNGINNINTETSNLLPYINFKYNVVTPSPSPDRQSEVKIVTGDNVVSIEGKNLFDKNNANIFNGYIASASPYSLTTSQNSKTLYIPCKKNTTYTIQKTISNYFRLAYTNELPKNNVNTYGFVQDETSSNLTITTGDNAKYLVCTYWVYNDTLTEQQILDSIQIEYGVSATTYEPYHIPQSYSINLGSMELCKIDTYQDYLYKNNNKWYLHKEIGKVVFDGSIDENINKATDGAFIRYELRGIGDLLKQTSRINMYSNYFLYASSGKGVGVCFAWWINNGTIFVYPEQTITSVAEMRTWLGTHNTICYYPLETPTYIQITDTTLIQQLNNIEKALSYDTQTNISQTNYKKPFIINAEAFVNMNLILNG